MVETTCVFNCDVKSNNTLYSGVSGPQEKILDVVQHSWKSSGTSTRILLELNRYFAIFFVLSFCICVCRFAVCEWSKKNSQNIQ